jgi:hypothetical protein
MYGDITRAGHTAELAEYLVRHVEEPLVMLTAKGCAAVQPGQGSAR